MGPIVIPFIATSLGRVEFDAHVMSGDRKSFEKVEFKLDSPLQIYSMEI